jgi:hypothetical protein
MCENRGGAESGAITTPIMAIALMEYPVTLEDERPTMPPSCSAAGGNA